LWACEEFSRVGENGGHGFGAEAVVFEVDEAGSLETFEYGLRGCFLLGRVAREEGREVDELCDVSELSTFLIV
jgi:hypothetical protein